AAFDLPGGGIKERRPHARHQDRLIRKTDVGRNPGSVAIVVAQIPGPVLAKEVEVALQPDVQLILRGGTVENAVPDREQACLESIAVAGREFDTERVVVTVRRNGHTGIGTEYRRRQLGFRYGLLMQIRGGEIDAVGQVIHTLEERVGAFLRRHKQIDGGVVVFIERTDECVVVARSGRAGAGGCRALVQRQVLATEPDAIAWRGGRTAGTNKESGMTL